MASVIFRGDYPQTKALIRINQNLESDILKRTRELQTANDSLSALNIQEAATLNEVRILEREENLINQLNAMLQLCVTAEEIYPRVQIKAQDIFQGLSGGLAIFNSANQQMETVMQWGIEQILAPFFSPDDCFGIRSGSINIVDYSRTAIPCNHYITPPQGGYMGIPMFVKNDLIAVFHLFAPPEQTLSKHTQDTAIAFSNIVKIALVNIKLRQALEEMSLKDALTDLFNRRYLNDFLPRELHRIQRDKGSLIVAMFDIDDFKKINDTFGHKAGDEVLKCIGKLLNQYFRASDMACRFGGEEFLVVMLSDDLNAAVLKLERLRESIKNEEVVFQGRVLPKTVLSIGVAKAPQDGITDDALIDAADQALYIAKQSGKDRIEIYQSKSS